MTANCFCSVPITPKAYNHDTAGLIRTYLMQVRVLSTGDLVLVYFMVVTFLNRLNYGCA
jgi:hypothetical protein